MFQNLNSANWAVLVFPLLVCDLASLGPPAKSDTIPFFYLLSISSTVFLLSSLLYSCPSWIMLFSFPNHCDFRKEPRVINILLNSSFLYIISLLFIGQNRHSEEITNYKIYKLLLKIVYTCIYLRHTNNIAI